MIKYWSKTAARLSAAGMEFHPSSEDRELVRDHFDPEFYREQSNLLEKTENELLVHYLTVGWRSGLDPSQDFSTNAYLDTYPDVREAGAQPLLHYLKHGTAEGRVAKSATRMALELAKDIVDVGFYKYRYRDIAGGSLDPVTHFVNFGWYEGRDPNPFTHLRFLKNYQPDAFTDFTTLVEFLHEPVHHNALLRRPVRLADLHIAIDENDKSLHDMFCFDVESYSRNQHDVKTRSKFHPIEHLFIDGLLQNRLRNAKHLNPLLLPVEDYVNDYEFLNAQDAPLKYANFRGLKLGESNAEKSADLSRAKVGVGLVLYENDRDEIERLVGSIVANLDGTSFTGQISICDNSPEPLDLDWISSLCRAIEVSVRSHPENPGFAKGQNSLMSECFDQGCTHYLGLNPDGFLLPGAIEAALRFALAKEHPALVELECEPISHPKWYHPVTGETEWVSGAAFLLDERTYELTGGFDPAFPMYCEDIDLSFRAFLAGVGLYVAPMARFYHDTSGRNHEPEPWRALRMMEGTWYLCEKWGNPERANSVLHEMSRQGFDTTLKPSRPDHMKNPHPKIKKLLNMERFARSRFWK